MSYIVGLSPSPRAILPSYYTSPDDLCEKLRDDTIIRLFWTERNDKKIEKIQKNEHNRN
jgi:hypothetical protein